MVGSAAEQEYYYGTGKRKTSIAKVRLYLDDGGPTIVNGKPVDEYFGWQPWQDIIQDPFRATEMTNRFRVMVRVIGGGVHSQAQAIRHGVSRALVAYDPGLKAELRRHGFITRDARIKESKKYGLKRARRAPQYTKR